MSGAATFGDMPTVRSPDSGFNTTDTNRMSKAATRALITRYLEALSVGDLDTVTACVSDDVIHDVNQGGERRIGRDRYVAYTARMSHHYSEQLSDIVILVNDDGSRAAAEFNITGKYVNTEDGLPPAYGQKYQLPAGIFFTIEADQISRVTAYYNLTDWITQVTAHPG